LRLSRFSATALFIVCLAGSSAFAQFPTAGRRFGSQIDTPAQEKAALDALSPNSQAVMQKLVSIGKLSANEFSYHKGDIPNGAAMDLNDSSWSKGTAPMSLPVDVTWVRIWVQVPKASMDTTSRGPGSASGHS